MTLQCLPLIQAKRQTQTPNIPECRSPTDTPSALKAEPAHGALSPVCHSNCTSMGAFSFKVDFLGQTFHRLLFQQLIVLLGPAVVTQMRGKQPEMLGQEWDPNWWHLLCHQDVPEALSSLTSLPLSLCWLSPNMSKAQPVSVRTGI